MFSCSVHPFSSQGGILTTFQVQTCGSPSSRETFISLLADVCSRSQNRCDHVLIDLSTISAINLIKLISQLNGLVKSLSGKLDDLGSLSVVVKPGLFSVAVDKCIQRTSVRNVARVLSSIDQALVFQIKQSQKWGLG